MSRATSFLSFRENLPEAVYVEYGNFIGIGSKTGTLVFQGIQYNEIKILLFSF
jgi:hypothetical protein